MTVEIADRAVAVRLGPELVFQQHLEHEYQAPVATLLSPS
jgi:hypothetical protein